jgi:hypothetical protein
MSRCWAICVLLPGERVGLQNCLGHSQGGVAYQPGVPGCGVLLQIYLGAGVRWGFVLAGSSVRSASRGWCCSGGGRLLIKGRAGRWAGGWGVFEFLTTRSGAC